jgi:outer membrane protein OmpA-like peptidoglycan-associated protein
MKLRILLLIAIIGITCQGIFAQNTVDTSKNVKSTIITQDSVMNKLRTVPDYRGIKGDSTVIPKYSRKQQDNFMNGISSYPPKPRNMWEVGIEGGTAFIASDVPSQVGWGGGVYVRKAIGYVVSFQLDALYDEEFGLGWHQQPGLEYNDVLNGGSKNPNLNYYASPGPGFVYDNYQCQMENLNIDAVFALNNIGYHHRAKNRKFMLNGIVGAAGLLYNTHINQLNSNGQPYPYAEIPSGDTKTQIIAILKSMLDNSYETEGDQAAGHAKVASEWIDPGFNSGMQLQYHISKHFNVGAEFLLTLIHDNALAGDPWQFNNSNAQFDAYHHEFLTIGYAIGGKHSVEPLYWQNPSDYTYDALKTIRSGLANMLQDADGDGVPDYLDQEPNTPAGWPVDTHGVSLKLDKNGVPHYDQKGTFTPSTIVESDLDSLKNQINNIQKNVQQELNDMDSKTTWFLPMIFFDFNNAKVKPEYYPELKYVATVMIAHPNMKVVVDGNADDRGTEAYNLTLSKNRAEAAMDHLVKTYGIDPSRLIVKYEGKAKQLVPGLEPVYPYKEDEQQVNRRVEFRVYNPKTDQ